MGERDRDILRRAGYAASPQIIPDPKITREEATKFLQYFKLKIMVEFGDIKSFARMYPELASIIYKVDQSLKAVR